jgi:tetratricopeptide (TPR) repeat protein
MKSIFFAAAIMICAAACQRAFVPAATPTSINQEITNSTGQVILAGKATPSAMQLPNHKNWFDQSYNSYTIDSISAQQVGKNIKTKSMEIFLGSWCGDSRREVPRMLKILQYAGVDTNRLSIIFVDNSPQAYKQSPQHEERGKNIHRVPTFIIYDGKTEVGRIVESPVVSLEKDLLAILNQSGYDPNYKAVNWWMQDVPGRTRDMSEAELTTAVRQLQPLTKSTAEFNSFGNVLMASGNTSEAINVFRLNSLLYPDNAAMFNNLAEALVRANRKTEAITVFEKLLALKPADEVVKKRIAELKM